MSNNINNDSNNDDRIYLERYSEGGFEPQYQSEHLNDNKYLLMSDEDYITWLKENIPPNCYNEEIYIKQLLKEKWKHQDFYKENIKDFQYGIWCFLKGEADEFELNHLPCEPLKYLKKNIGFINKDDINDFIIYDCNLEIKGTLLNSEITWCGFYVPQRSIQFINKV